MKFYKRILKIGFGLGAYQYALKMFVYHRVRARNFARAWSFVQASQALPLICGIPLAGKPIKLYLFYVLNIIIRKRFLNDRVRYRNGLLSQ